jgi:4-hydroxy-tetrahydrodipicolinate synthase
MAAADLKGVIAASITPIAPDLTIDVGRLAVHVERLLRQGCSFVSTFGTTGEGASLSTREKLDALAALRAAGADMGRQVPGVMAASLDEAAAMLAGIEALGCRAALVLPPFYYAATERGIADWFEALAARSGAKRTDIVLYNIPQLSRVRLTSTLVEAIRDRLGPQAAAIKDSTGDIDSGLAFVRAFPDLAIFTGDDRVLPSLLAAGGAGMIGGLPNLFAHDLLALCADPRRDDLLARQTERIVAVDAMGSLTALKAGLAHYLGDEEYARPLPPLAPLDAAARAELVAAFERTGFDAAA